MIKNNCYWTLIIYDDVTDSIVYFLVFSPFLTETNVFPIPGLKR